MLLYVMYCNVMFNVMLLSYMYYHKSCSITLTIIKYCLIKPKDYTEYRIWIL